MPPEYSRRLVRIRLEAPLATIVCAAQDDAVLSRHHVQVAGPDRDVVNLGLRRENGELALDRHDVRVVEQLSRRQPGAVDDYGFAQRSDRASIGKLAQDNASAGDSIILKYCRQID